MPDGALAPWAYQTGAPNNVSIGECVIAFLTLAQPRG